MGPTREYPLCALQAHSQCARQRTRRSWGFQELGAEAAPHLAEEEALIAEPQDGGLPASPQLKELHGGQHS